MTMSISGQQGDWESHVGNFSALAGWMWQVGDHIGKPRFTPVPSWLHMKGFYYYSKLSKLFRKSDIQKSNQEIKKRLQTKSQKLNFGWDVRFQALFLSNFKYQSRKIRLLIFCLHICLLSWFDICTCTTHGVEVLVYTNHWGLEWACSSCSLQMESPVTKSAKIAYSTIGGGVMWEEGSCLRAHPSQPNMGHTSTDMQISLYDTIHTQFSFPHNPDVVHRLQQTRYNLKTALRFDPEAGSVWCIPDPIYFDLDGESHNAQDVSCNFVSTTIYRSQKKIRSSVFTLFILFPFGQEFG